MKQIFAAALLAMWLTRPALAQDAAPDAASDAPPPMPEMEAPPPDAAAAPEATAPQPYDTIPVEVAVPTPAPVVAAPAGPHQLEDIVVTAQKTTQTLQQVPLSITAINKEQIKFTGSNTLADLSAYIPNVRIDADDIGSPQIFIRGFGTNTFNPSFESSVGFVEDEIVFGRPGYFTDGLFDIERVEVLRGPQGTLFGKNTIAGVFSLTSTEPGEELEANLDVRGGSHGERKVEGGVGGAFADWGSARASAVYRHENGELHNSFLDRSEDRLEQHAERLKVRLTPTPYLVSELTLLDSKTTIPFWPFQLLKLDDDTRQYVRRFDPAVEDNPYDFNTSFDTAGFTKKGSSTAGWKTDWAIPQLGGVEDFHSVLVLGASKFFIDQLNELDTSPADLLRLDDHEDHWQLSGELRFTGRADSLFGLGDEVEFVGGAFWFRSNYVLLAQVLGGKDLASYFTTCDFQQLASKTYPMDCTTAPPLPLPPAILALVGGAAIGDDRYTFDYTQDVRSEALFGQLTWHLNDHWAITPGLRFNKEHKQVEAAGHSHCPGRDQAPGRPCVVEQLVTANDYDEPGLIRDESDLSPKFVLQYFTSGNVNFYASLARGFKSGGFNAISFTGDKPADPGNPPLVAPSPEVKLEYEAEKARTKEIGMKGKFFGKTLRFNLTVYETKFDNLQVLAFSGLFPIVSNAAAATSRGLESDLTWNTPLEWLSFVGSVGLLSARYDRYPGAPAPISHGIGALQDLGGQRIAFAPSKSATITPVLTFPIGSLLLHLSADAIYQGDQYTDTDLDPNTYVGSYWKYAARAVLGSQDESWSLVIGGSNLTDKRVLNQVTDALLFPGTYYAQAAGGRALFATLGFKL